MSQAADQQAQARADLDSMFRVGRRISIEVTITDSRLASDLLHAVCPLDPQERVQPLAGVEVNALRFNDLEWAEKTKAAVAEFKALLVKHSDVFG